VLLIKFFQIHPKTVTDANYAKVDKFHLLTTEAATHPEHPVQHAIAHRNCLLMDHNVNNAKSVKFHQQIENSV